MYVRDYMTKAPITINKKTPVFEALEIMKKYKIRQLPVVSEGKLVGMVTEKGLLTVSPSTATSLSVFELNYLLSKMTVSESFVKNLQTVTPDATLEAAALLMRENRVGSAPVVDEEGNLVGIITVIDVFDALIKFSGYGKPGTRFVIEAEDIVHLMDNATQVVKEHGVPVQGIICSVIDNERARMVLKLGTIDTEPIVEAMKKRGLKVNFEN